MAARTPQCCFMVQWSVRIWELLWRWRCMRWVLGENEKLRIPTQRDFVLIVHRRTFTTVLCILECRRRHRSTAEFDRGMRVESKSDFKNEKWSTQRGGKMSGKVTDHVDDNHIPIHISYRREGKSCEAHLNSIDNVKRNKSRDFSGNCSTHRVFSPSKARRPHDMEHEVSHGAYSIEVGWTRNYESRQKRSQVSR